MADERKPFCVVSLIDWLDLCQELEIPYVPAEVIATFERDDILKFDTPGPHQARLAEAMGLVNDAMLEDTMTRWDCCAPLELKIALSEGDSEWRTEFYGLVFDDPRAYDIIADYPRVVVPALRRPWVEPTLIDRWPLEYRLFVKNGQWWGTSNYYPQRSLPSFPQQLALVQYYGLKLSSALADRNMQWPLSQVHRLVPPILQETDSDLSLNGVHFTADFMVSGDGEVLFLEGGPPHEMGAHPCCFVPGEIEGVALEDRNEDIPL